MLDQAHSDVLESELVLRSVRDCFRREVCLRADGMFRGLLEPVVDIVGGALHIQCDNYELDTSSTIPVIVSNEPYAYEAALRVCVRVPVDEGLLRLRESWADAVVKRNNASNKVAKITEMKKDARDILLKSEIDSDDELKTAISKAAKRAKDKV